MTRRTRAGGSKNVVIEYAFHDVSRSIKLGILVAGGATTRKDMLGVGYGEGAI